MATKRAQILNMAELAKDLRVGLNTAKLWLAFFEATYQVIISGLTSANVGKRLVKSP